MQDGKPVLLNGMTLLALFYYVAAIAIAELIGVLIGAVPQVLYHALLILLMLTHFVVKGRNLYRRLLPPMALVCLMRILSIAMPSPDLPEIAWYVLIGAPLLVSIGMAARLLELSPERIGLSGAALPMQLLIGIVGFPLSVLGFVLLRPAPLASAASSAELLALALLLVVFVGLTEELLFRGLLQAVATELFGRWGVLVSALLSAIMYAGTLSPSFIAFMAVIGLIFGWYVWRTGSILGVTLAHSGMVVGMGLLWPAVARDQPALFASLSTWGLWIALTLALIALTGVVWPIIRRERA